MASEASVSATEWQRVYEAALDVPLEKLEEYLFAMIGRVMRNELRRVGLRPPPPSEYGTWRWNAETDAWERSDG